MRRYLPSWRMTESGWISEKKTVIIGWWFTVPRTTGRWVTVPINRSIKRNRRKTTTHTEYAEKRRIESYTVFSFEPTNNQVPRNLPRVSFEGSSLQKPRDLWDRFWCRHQTILTAPQPLIRLLLVPLSLRITACVLFGLKRESVLRKESYLRYKLFQPRFLRRRGRSITEEPWKMKNKFTARCKTTVQHNAVLCAVTSCTNQHQKRPITLSHRGPFCLTAHHAQHPAPLWQTVGS